MKKVLSIVLALLLVLALFTGCAESELPSGDDPTPPAGGSEDGADADKDNEIAEIDFWISNLGGDVSQLDAVETALNAVTETSIGVRVNLEVINVVDYGTQLALAISNREGIDLALYNPLTTWMSLYNSGSILDMTELLDTYCPQIKEMFGQELLRANTVDGAVYGLSNYRQLNSNIYACWRTDVLEQAGALELSRQ